MRRNLLRTIAAVAAALVAAAGPATATTEPQTTHFAKVKLTDAAIVLSLSAVPRGAIVIFTVNNRSRHPRTFAVGGYETSYIKPGAKAHFQLNFMYRGKYAYVSRAKGSKRLTGTFVVS